MEVQGEVATFFDGDVAVTIFFDDVTTNITRVESTAVAGYVASVTVSNLNRSRTFEHVIPVGTVSISIPKGIASRITFGNDVADDDLVTPVEPGDILVVYDVRRA